MKRNANLWCRTEKCKYNKKHLKADIDDSNDDFAFSCPECGEVMKVMGYNSYGGYAKVNSMSKEEKKSALLKRSHDHYKKEIKERKIQMIRDQNKKPPKPI